MASIQSGIDVARSLQIASSVVFYYDYLLTLHNEVRYFWNLNLKEKRFSTILFLLNRYIQLGGITANVAFFVKGTTESDCRSLAIFDQYFVIATQILINAVQIRRTHAYYLQSQQVLYSLILLVVSTLSVTLWAVSSSLPNENGNLGGVCQLLLAASRTHLVIAWGCLLTFNTIIVMLTAYQSYKLRDTFSKELIVIMFRDGTLHFLVFAAACTFDIAASFVFEPPMRGVGTILTNVLASVVTSRIIINLRETLAVPHPEMIKINDGTGSVSTMFNMVESEMSFLASGENDHGD